MSVDVQTCRELVYDKTGWGHHYRCQNKAKAGRDCCGVHSPEAVARRKQKAEERYEAERGKCPTCHKSWGDK